MMAWLQGSRGPIARAAAMASILAAIAILGAAGAKAQPQERQVWSVTVNGEGSIEVAPDVAVIRVGVVSAGKTAREASQTNAKAVMALLDVLKQAGIAAEDIQTSRFSVQVLYDPNRTATSRITGFQANNQVSVKLHDTERVGDIIDRIVAAGANEVSGIDFHVTAASQMLDNAREQAMADARRRAEVYARAAGLGLGRAMSIVEQSASGKPIAMRAATVKGTTTPIAPGRETLHVAVTVTFELLR